MHRLIRPALLLLTVFAIGGFASANTYYIAANGSDTNSGTSNTSPWQHAPGMTNCKSTCGSVTPQPGDSIIFRGGDTWHFGNSALTPYVGANHWNFSQSGTSGNVIYIGVNTSWYAGSAFARPIFNGDDPVTTSVASSCPYDYNNINVVMLGTDNHIRLDNIEMTGFCYNATARI